MVINKISAVTKMDFQWNYKQRSSETILEIIETIFLTDFRDKVKISFENFLLKKNEFPEYHVLIKPFTEVFSWIKEHRPSSFYS